MNAANLARLSAARDETSSWSARRSEPRSIVTYGAAVLTVGVALIATLAMDVDLVTAPVALLFCAIAWSARYGGLAPGLLALALSVLAFVYCFVVPTHSLMPDIKEVLRVLIVTLSGLFVAAMSAAQRRRRTQLEQIDDGLEKSERAMRITQRKTVEAEHRKLTERLREAEKMAVIGRFAGGIVHDFNNVLSCILAYGEMLNERVPEASSQKRYATNVLAAAARGQALVEQILAYSRPETEDRDPTDLRRTVADALDLLRGSMPAHVTLDWHAPQTPLMVLANPTQLHRVVINLCCNAKHAMGAGGTLRVSLASSDESEARALSHGSLKAGRYACLNVEDSGCGMDEATLARIFEPFFTTKKFGLGTGLGLSLVHGIVTDLAGAIDVKSAVGRGSVFAVYLPLLEDGRKRS
ncbi:MAG TPA: ATP-binding protein [Casimicrobiaceae bacterium]|nr:ATP-binding protein [Casimicrobiaceae bacterium]